MVFLSKFTQMFNQKSEKRPLVELLKQGEQLITSGKWQEAARFLQQAAKRADKEHDRHGQLEALKLLCRVYTYHGDYQQAMNISQQALALVEQIGDQRLLGSIYDQMGIICCMQGDTRQAIAYHKKSQQQGFYQDEGDLAASYSNLGNVYTQQRDFGAAIEAYQKALDLCYKAELKQLTGVNYSNLGGVLLQIGEYDLAMEALQEGVKIFSQFGDLHGIANSYSNMGNVQYHRGNYEQALQMHEKALKTDKQTGDIPGIAKDHVGIARVLEKLGNISRTFISYQEGLTLAEQIGDAYTSAHIHANLGRLYHKQGDREQARMHYEQAKALFGQIGDMQSVQRMTQKLGQV